jgi:hypothetical protein
MSIVTLGSLFKFTGAHVKKGAASADAPDWADFSASLAADRLNEALNIDVFELLAEAWLKFKQVRDCADPSKHPPGEVTLVQLKEVTVTSRNAPFLRPTSNGAALMELRFELELVAKFDTLELVIRDAHIRSLRPGAAQALVSLKYGASKLAEHATPRWQLPGEIALPGDGIPVCRQLRSAEQGVA